MQPDYGKQSAIHINNTIRTRYGSPHYMNPNILGDLFSNKGVLPIFVIYLTSKFRQDLQSKSIALGLDTPLPPKNQYVDLINQTIIDVLDPSNQKELSSLNRLWDEKKYSKIFQMIETHKNQKLIFSWFMQFKVNISFFQSIFPDISTTSTLKDFVIKELAKENFFDLKATFIPECEKFDNMIQQEKYKEAEEIIIPLIKNEPLIPIPWLLYSILLILMERKDDANLCMKFGFACNYYDPDFKQLLINPDPLITNYILKLDAINFQQISDMVMKITSKFNSPPIKPADEQRLPSIPSIPELLPLLPSSELYTDPQISPQIEAVAEEMAFKLSPRIMGRIFKGELPYSINFARISTSSNTPSQNPTRKQNLWEIISKGVFPMEKSDPLWRKLWKWWDKGYYNQILNLLISPNNNFESAKKVHSWFMSLNLNQPPFTQIISQYKRNTFYDLAKSELEKSYIYPKVEYASELDKVQELIKKKKYSKAIKLSKKNLAKDPFSYQDWMNIAMCKHYLNDYPRDILLIALACGPYMSQAWYFLADISK